jgi:mannitol-specific phosphotransferase system IIBC component
MNNHQLDNDTISCTAMGTLLVILNNINPGELLNSVVIAATGTVVSFIVSLLCKFIWSKMKEE